MAGMARYAPNQRYYHNGFTGTSEEHAARQRTKQDQEPYDASQPSAGAASTAARSVNPNLDFNVSSTGATSLNNQSEQQRRMAQLTAQLAGQADDREFQQQTTNQNRFLSATRSSAPSQPVVSHAGAGGASEADARAAAFSRAKDQAGRIARSSLTSIAEQMASKGMSGASIQALSEAGAIDGAAGGLLELNRDQAMSDVNRAADVADLDYTGRVTQRGQDLNNRQSYLSLLSGLY
jgi:hypothetical protein